MDASWNAPCMRTVGRRAEPSAEKTAVSNAVRGDARCPARARIAAMPDLSAYAVTAAPTPRRSDDGTMAVLYRAALGPVGAERYLPAFERVVTEAQPTTVMSAYNAINGVFASENAWLLTELLRGEWGFEGLVVSDWGAIKDRVEALRAGLDLEMPGTGDEGRDAIVAAVRDGRLDRALVDRSLERLRTLADRTAVGEAVAAVDADAVVDVDLDPVGAVAGLLAHRADALVDAADLLRAAGQLEVGAEAARAWPVAVGGDDRAGGDEQPRAGDQSIRDRLLQADVGVARAFSPQIADRGETGEQSVAQMIGRPRHAQA